MNVLITGDFYVSDSHRGAHLFDSSVEDLFTHADCRITNLEAPITVNDKRNEILKTGPYLSATKETILPLLGKLKIDLVTLANNHIMDYGRPGLLDTLVNLKHANVSSVGAGLDLRDAEKPLILEKGGIRIAVLNFAENEWANATHKKPGANPLSLIDNLKQIHAAKQMSEFTVLIIHGGYEDFPLPSPRMVKQYRFYAENGASIIIGHHPHCISGYEVYRGCPIFYSLGNFIFTQASKLESWYTGLILNLQIQRDRDISWDLVPVLQSRSDYVVTLAKGQTREEVKNEIEEYGQVIRDESRLYQKWEMFLSAWRSYYLNVFSPMNFIQNKFIKNGLTRLGLDRLFIKKKHYAQILNHIRCDSHTEASQAIIEKCLE